MTDIKVEIPVVTNSRKKFNQRLTNAIKSKLENLGASTDPENLAQIINLMNEGKNKTQVQEELTTMFGEDKIKSTFVDWLFGYANACTVPSPELEPEEVLPSPSIKSEKSSSNKDKLEKKAENKSKTKRRASQSSRSHRNSRIIDSQTPLSPPLSPQRSTKASSICSSDYEKSQKNIYHQRRLSRSANTLDLTSQVQSEIMAQTLALAAAAAVDLQIKSNVNGMTDKEIKSERRRSVRSIRSRQNSLSSMKEEDTSKIRCSYWPNCNRGDQCKFWHPKELCKKFPHCPDGDHCLFIHPAPVSNPPSKPQSIPHSHSSSNRRSIIEPNLSSMNTNTTTNNQERVAVECKYGANCTRLDCKFSHPSPAAAKMASNQNNTTVQTVTSSTTHHHVNESNKSNVPCHFYPNCKNPDCPYMHPTPAPVQKTSNETVNVACRYGSACTRADCHFLHPSNRRISSK